jgi:hypothetical protein
MSAIVDAVLPAGHPGHGRNGADSSEFRECGLGVDALRVVTGADGISAAVSAPMPKGSVSGGAVCATRSPILAVSSVASVSRCCQRRASMRRVCRILLSVILSSHGRRAARWRASTI